MALIGGNTEKKEIGLSIGISGTHDKTKINKDTGFLELVDIDEDGEGKPIYVEQGSWTSDVINLGDIFQDFEKVFTDSKVNGSSSFAVLTRVSSNNYDWSDWVAIAEDGTIQSDTKQFIQVRIDLFAGFVTDVFTIANSDFNTNEFIEEKEVKAGSYVVPKLTSSSPTPFGFPFASSELNTTTNAIWRAFDKLDTNHYFTSSKPAIGFLGYCFTDKILISKYKIRSVTSGTILNVMPKKWILQGSNDTTNGINGTWKDLDTQENQTWTTNNTNKEYSISISEPYHAYRINWSENNGYSGNTGINELDFYVDGTTSLQLKREYEHDMTLDSTWSDTGSLHRKKITRSQWQRIDKLNVMVVDN